MPYSAANAVVGSVATFKQYRLKPNPFESFRDPQTGKWGVVFNLPGGKVAEKAPAKPDRAQLLLAQTLPVQTAQEMSC